MISCKTAALVAPCCVAPRAVVASSRCRASSTQHLIPTFRRVICVHSSYVCGRPSKTPLCSQRSAPHASSAPHDSATVAAAGSEIAARRYKTASGLAASVTLLPLLLRALQPGPAFANEAVTALQQATSAGDVAVEAAGRVISSVGEALAPGGDSSMSLPASGMSLTDTVTSVLFVLAVLALLVLTLGVAYLTITSFLDDRREKEDLKSIKPPSSNGSKPASGKLAKKRPKSASRGGGKGFGNSREF